MTRRPDPSWSVDERRNARIRELRAQREVPDRRRSTFRPLVMGAWFAGVAVLAALAIFGGFLLVAPGLMAWVEEHPGLVEHGLVRDFVNWYDADALADVPAAEDGRRITIVVESGASDSEIGQLLFDEGLINSQLAFQYAVFRAGREGSLQAGSYDLSPSLTPSQIVAALRQEAGEEVTITIREGLRLEEIAAYLGTTSLTMSVEDFAGLITNPPADLIAEYPTLASLPTGASLEGYLYPDTYRVDANWSAREIVALLLGNFETRLTSEIRDQIAASTLGGSPMTLHDALTLASIVEREAVLDAERPLIAGVYVNRLNTPGWRIDADPTLQYGLATAEFGDAPVSEWGAIDWWTPLQAGGQQVVLPEELIGYQTYQHDGLPPSPISAPRIASIAAVAAPNTADGYFFFVAACPGGVRDGSHYFARTLAEHNANIARANAECPAS